MLSVFFIQLSMINAITGGMLLILAPAQAPFTDYPQITNNTEDWGYAFVIVSVFFLVISITLWSNGL